MCNSTTTLHILFTLVLLLQFNSLRNPLLHIVRRRTCLNQTLFSSFCSRLGKFSTLWGYVQVFQGDDFEMLVGQIRNQHTESPRGQTVTWQSQWMQDVQIIEPLNLICFPLSKEASGVWLLLFMNEYCTNISQQRRPQSFREISWKDPKASLNRLLEK